MTDQDLRKLIQEVKNALKQEGQSTATRWQQWCGTLAGAAEQLLAEKENRDRKKS